MCIRDRIITKAIDSTVGGWKNDMFICHDQLELQAAYAKIQSPEVMLQKYIVKDVYKRQVWDSRTAGDHVQRISENVAQYDVEYLSLIHI